MFVCGVSQMQDIIDRVDGYAVLRTHVRKVAINPGECAAQLRVSEKNFVAECATKFFSETGQVSCTAGCRSRLSAGRFSHMVSPEVWDKPARYRENQEWLRLRRATCEFELIRAPSFDPMSSGQQDAFRGYLCDGGDRFLAPWFVMVPLTFSAFSHYLSRQRYCRFGFRGCRRWFTLVLYISIYLPSIFLDLRTPAIYPTGWQYHCQERSGHAEVMSKLDSTTNQAEAPNGERKGITHQTGRDGRRCQLGQWAFPKDTPTLEIAGIRIFWASLWLSVFC
jgi:hypothetical protein